MARGSAYWLLGPAPRDRFGEVALQKLGRNGCTYLVETGAERQRQLGEDQHRDIVLAALDTGDVGAVDAESRGDILLAEAALRAQPPQGRPDRRKHRVGHVGILRKPRGCAMQCNSTQVGVFAELVLLEGSDDAQGASIRPKSARKINRQCPTAEA